MRTMNYTCWFTEGRAANPDLVGDRGAELNHLWVSGLPIHPGFCITVDAYNFVLKVTGLNRPIDRILAETNFEDPEEIAAQGLVIRDLIKEQPIPQEIASEVLENYIKLGRFMGFRHLEGMPVSIEPSFTVIGSLHKLSVNPAQVYLNIRGGCSILKHIRCCWTALWSPESLLNLHRFEIDHDLVKIAVVVQTMEYPRRSPDYANAHMNA
jgi:pyruvate,water dikinase